MASHDLKVAIRQETGKSYSRRLRYDGKLPAVVYGRKEEPIKLVVDAKELRDFLAHHGSHGLFSLKADDGTATPAIIKALQRHPFKNHIQTIDFLRVSLSEEVTATVPVVLEGEPVGVKEDGGVLVHSLHEIEITCLPQNLPEAIHVDVSALELAGAPVLVSEITVPEGITVLTDGEEPIAVVNHPAVEEEPETEEVAADEVPAEHGDTEESAAAETETTTE